MKRALVTLLGGAMLVLIVAVVALLVGAFRLFTT